LAAESDCQGQEVSMQVKCHQSLDRRKPAVLFRSGFKLALRRAELTDPSIPVCRELLAVVVDDDDNDEDDDEDDEDDEDEDGAATEEDDVDGGEDPEEDREEG